MFTSIHMALAERLGDAIGLAGRCQRLRREPPCGSSGRALPGRSSRALSFVRCRHSALGIRPRAATLSADARCSGQPPPARGLLLAGLGGCTAADNLSYGDLVYELDAIVAVEGADEQRAIVYRDHAATSNWYMRQFWARPPRWPLGWTFGKRSKRGVEEPGPARARAAGRAARRSGRRSAGQRAAGTAGRVAGGVRPEQRQPRDRARRALAEVAQRLALPVLPAPAEALLVLLEAATAAAAQATLAQHAAGLRGETVLAADERAASLQALQVVVAAPLSGLAARLQLAQQLALLQYEAADAELAAAADAALQAAPTHVVAC